MAALLKHAGIVSLATLISRLLGYVRDALIAMQLGAGVLNDVFILALRLPNLFRSLFAEGAFSAAFVPMLASRLEEKGEGSAKKLAAGMQNWLMLALVLFCGLLYVLMPTLVVLTAPGLAQDSASYTLAVELSRITTPYLFFISMAAFYGGILNTSHRYFAFASAPVLLNIAMIIAASLAPKDQVVRWLSNSVTIGGMVELAWVLYFLYRAKWTLSWTMPRWNEDVRKLLHRLWPCALGSGVAQINVWVDTVLASLVPSAISYLYYADRINQLPLALIGTALGTVLLPQLSRHRGGKNDHKALQLQNKAIELGLFLAIPAAVAIHYMSLDVILLLLTHGDFSLIAAERTANALSILACGLPAYVLVKVFVASFYSTDDTRTPAKIAACCIINNVVISLLLIPHIAHLGIAVASTVSAWFNAMTLGFILSRRGLLRLGFRQLLASGWAVICSGFMVWVLLILAEYCANAGVPILYKIALQACLGGVFYLGIGYLPYYFVKSRE